MQEHCDRLGISPEASPDEIKAAYHAKLREFPAHTHPQEFKAIRAAYDALRQGLSAAKEDFFSHRAIAATLDPALLESLRQRAQEQLQVSLDDLLRLTF
jgi:curved DNA-binding protein CbpA